MRRWLQHTVALLSRMSTAVFLLGLLALASVVGTVFLQDQPRADYQQVFGQFWAEVFMLMGFHRVYSAWWYMAILALLWVSISVCLVTNGPRLIKLGRRPKRLPGRAQLQSWPLQRVLTEAEARRLQKKLLRQGFVGSFATAGGRYFTRGGWSRVGYFLSHIGVLVLVVSGALTGFMGFRGTLHLPAGAQMNAVWVPEGEGGAARQLPFALGNDGFALTTYPDGTPQKFTTRLVITAASGKTLVRDLAVNAPVRYHDHSIYQSSFGDAGSRVVLSVLPLNEWTALRSHPVLPMVVQDEKPLGLTRVKLVDARMHETRHLVTPNQPGPVMRDVGPSVDVMLTRPDQQPRLLRLYLQHPDILGVAQTMSAEGTPLFATVPLGLNPATPQAWGLYFAVQNYRRQHPGVDINTALVKVSAPFVRGLTEEARVTHVAQTLQALSITQNLELPFLLGLQHITPAYYTALQVTYDPGFWWFVLGGMMLIAGVFLMVYADHWRVWFVPHHGKVLLAAHAARRHDGLQEWLG